MASTDCSQTSSNTINIGNFFWDNQNNYNSTSGQYQSIFNQSSCQSTAVTDCTNGGNTNLSNALLQAFNSTINNIGVNLAVAYPANSGIPNYPNYLNTTVSNGNFLNGSYTSYCIDVDSPITPGTTYQATAYSSYSLNSLPKGVVDKPGNLDELNWLINQNYLGQSSGKYGNYTSGDLQLAIWTLINGANQITQEDRNTLNAVGGYNQNRVNQLISNAQKNGCGFVPGISADGTPQNIGVILVPKDGNGNLAQTTLNVVKTAALGDSVWEDRNGNGIQDNNEVGVQGVTVTLTGGGKDGIVGTGDDTVVTTTTDANGAYFFSLLVPGVQYKVTFSNLPTGFVFTAPNQGSDITKDSNANPTTGATDIITLSPQEFNRSIDAGIYKLSSLSGYVYIDSNNNGVKDAKEIAIAGATITLTGTDDLGKAINITAKTAADGSYSFKNLRSGTYTLSETQPTGYFDGKDAVGSQGGTLANDSFTAIKLTSGVNGLNNNFGEISPNSISDSLQAFNVTVNNKGINLVVAYPGSSDIPNYPNYLNTNVTNGNFLNGSYTSYCVDVDSPITPGSTYQATAYSSYSPNSLPSGVIDKPENLEKVNWLINQKYVGQSSGNNGNYTSGDLQLAIWNLMNNANQITPDDLYTLNAVGGYNQNRVEQLLNDAEKNGCGFVPGISADGIPQNVGVILVPKDGNGNLAQTTVNVFKTAALGDSVWEDRNGNGIKDNNEVGVQCVTVTLTGGGKDGIVGTADDTVTTTTTDANGSYLFSLLVPGVQYKATFSDIPTGYVFTAPNQGSDITKDSNANPTTGATDIITLSPQEFNRSIDAGIYKSSSLAGYVYVDSNNNGVKDAREAGINGAIITLTGTDDLGKAVNITAKTGADGSYSFKNLRNGIYSLNETQPNGYLDGKDAVGSQGGILGNNSFTAIKLTPGVVGINNNFGELLSGSTSNPGCGDQTYNLGANSCFNSGDSFQDIFSLCSIFGSQYNQNNQSNNYGISSNCFIPVYGC